jgi:hypothetical protein
VQCLSNSLNIDTNLDTNLDNMQELVAEDVGDVMLVEAEKDLGIIGK